MVWTVWVIRTVLNTEVSEVENKIPNASNLVNTEINEVLNTVLNTEINEVENKIPGDSKCITTQKFDKFIAESFAARLKRVDWVDKADFDKELTSFNRRITWNKTKYVEVKKKLNSLIINDYNFFSDRIYLASNDGSQKQICLSTNTWYIRIKKWQRYWLYS